MLPLSAAIGTLIFVFVSSCHAWALEHYACRATHVQERAPIAVFKEDDVAFVDQLVQEVTAWLQVGARTSAVSAS